MEWTPVNVGAHLGGRRGTQGSHPLPGDSVQHAAVSWRALGVLAFVPPFSGVFNAIFSFQVTSMGFYLGFLKRGSSPPGEAAGRSSHARPLVYKSPRRPTVKRATGVLGVLREILVPWFSLYSNSSSCF